jgi:hypothetical protein
VLKPTTNKAQQELSCERVRARQIRKAQLPIQAQRVSFGGRGLYQVYGAALHLLDDHQSNVRGYCLMLTLAAT